MAVASETEGERVCCVCCQRAVLAGTQIPASRRAWQRQRLASPLSPSSSSTQAGWVPSARGAPAPLPEPCAMESGLLPRSAPLPWVRARFSLLLNNSEKQQGPAKGPGGDVGREMLCMSAKQLMVGAALTLFVPRMARSSSG